MTFEADGDLAAVHDDRDAALVARALQHVGHSGCVLQHVDVLDRGALLLVGFTSRLGVRSAVFAENEDLGGHASLR